MATNGNLNFQDGAGQQATTQSSQGLGNDEVAWFFVEQFYTTMSKSPEKLHLFYNKRSQFVQGMEAEISKVSVGREQIRERIKNLDFQECKVRVTNVDSQESGDNIVIQVIGELSNKSAEPNKFVQTFVLAKQPSGYFVLNDIVRYIDENIEEEEPQETAAPVTEAAPAEAEVPAVEAAQTEPEPVTETKAEEPAAQAEPAQLDTAVIDEKLEDATSAAKDAAPAAAEPAAAEPAADAPVEVEPTVVETKKEETPAEPVKTEEAAAEVVQEEAKQKIESSETPKEPVTTPVAGPKAAPKAAPVAAEPEKPKGPPKPMTWASMASRMAGPAKPAVALPKPATPTATPTQPRPAAASAPPQQQKPAASASQPSEAAPASTSTPAPASKDDEWQSVGADSKRQNRPVSNTAAGSQGPGQEGAMAYIKYVTDKVKAEDLRAALSQFGELVYFDIHRQKNCAFAEYSTPAGYQAAVAANPLTVNGENIVVEQRRPKASAFGGSSYGRGGGGGRGRGGFDGQRSGSQGGGRGGFAQQGRGGRGGAARGNARPAPQASS